LTIDSAVSPAAYSVTPALNVKVTNRFWPPTSYS